MQKPTPAKYVPPPAPPHGRVPPMPQGQTAPLHGHAIGPAGPRPDMPFMMSSPTGSEAEKQPKHLARNFFTTLLTILSLILMALTFPFSLILGMKVVKEYERAVIFRLGRLLHGGAKGPGLFFVIPCIDSYRKVDLRVVSFDVPPQEILSKDSVTVSVDAVVYFRISNPIISVTNVNDAFYSTKLLAQTTLRNVLGMKTLQEMLAEREHISHLMQTVLDEATDNWGVKVKANTLATSTEID